MQALNIARLLVAWFILYLATGYISLFLDDPVSRVSYVWFPAGVAVSAFLLTGRAYWPALFLTLFIARLLLDVTLRHSLETSLLHAAISLGNDITIAYCVIRFGRPNDRLHRMLIWLIATFSLSALAAVPGAGWLVLRQGLDFSQTFGIWWSANVIGVILFTTIIMGLVWKTEPASIAQKILAVVLWLLLCISTWYVFHQSIDSPRGEALLFGLACLPVILMILIPVLVGNRVGAFSLLCFSSIVIYYSWQQTGPFFIPGLHPGEPLLLAQCYLSGTALLLSFIYVLRQKASAGRWQRRLGPGKGKATYYLEPGTGRLTWDHHLNTSLSQMLAHIHSVDQFLALLAPEIRSEMQARWLAVQRGELVEETFQFQLNRQMNPHLQVQESKLIGLNGPDGIAVVGYLEENPHSGLSFHHSRGG